VLGRLVSSTDGTSSVAKWEAIALSEDHSLQTNTAERERLIKEHPGESDVLGSPRDPRVKGMLQPSRAFGDGVYKSLAWKPFYRSSPHMRVWTPPYITAVPDVTTHVLGTTDRFLVLGTGIVSSMADSFTPCGAACKASASCVF